MSEPSLRTTTTIRDEAIKRADAVPGSTHAVENIAAGVDAALRVIRERIEAMPNAVRDLETGEPVTEGEPFNDLLHRADVLGALSDV